MRQRHCQDQFPFGKRIRLDEVEKVPYALFANISLPDGVRTPALPQILRHPPFVEELRDLFREVHEAVKVCLKAATPKRIPKKST